MDDAGYLSGWHGRRGDQGPRIRGCSGRHWAGRLSGTDDLKFVDADSLKYRPALAAFLSTHEAIDCAGSLSNLPFLPFHQFTGQPGRCPRCHIPLRLRQRQSLQKSWAALIASIILLFPANLLPISIIYVNGARTEDTIFSGILSLASGNVPVALVVFIASILVPFTKVMVLFGLLVSIHLRSEANIMMRMKMLRVIRWIGRWSMLDLFVIALTMSLVNRDQLLAFTMGPAAFTLAQR